MNFLLEKLRGHRGSVSCLTSYDDCIVSGSEDKTVRLWDLRTRKTFKCINSCFSDAIEDVQLNPKDRNYLFVASGSQLLSFDTRFDGVINREPIATYNNVGEINRLSLSPKEPLIAIGDDSNDIRIVSYSNNGELFENSAVYRAKLLRRGHTSLVNALSFRSTNPKELFSGGFDCVGNIWDTGLAKVKTSINLAVNNIEEGDGCNRMFNPPHVHAGQYLDSGKAIIVALGDGSVSLPFL